VGEQNKAVINLKNTALNAGMSVKHLCTARPAGRKSIRPVRKALKKITNAIKTHNYTERDKR
jgi:hypothetical protein